MKLSVCIITLNEEENLDRCLKFVEDFSDEIVLVDSGSIDKTLEIAKKFNAQIYAHKFTNYGQQKNFAASKATGEWLLFVDADEVIPKELGKEVMEAIEVANCDGYLIPRRNMLLGREIKHSRWSPDKHIWLYRKSKGKWVGEIHEEVVVEGEVCELVTAKIHYSYKTIQEFIDMTSRYTELTAETMVAGGRKFSMFRLFFDPMRSFVGRYFYKMGFLDGIEGFSLALLMMQYRVITWLKVWEKQNDKKN